MKLESSGGSPRSNLGCLRRSISAPYRDAFIGTASWLSCSLPNSPFFSSLPGRISRVLPNKCMYVSLTESGSQATLPEPPDLPPPSFSSPFSLSLPLSLCSSSPSLSDYVVSHLPFSLTFYLILFSPFRPASSALAAAHCPCSRCHWFPTGGSLLG